MCQAWNAIWNILETSLDLPDIKKKKKRINELTLIFIYLFNLYKEPLYSKLKLTKRFRWQAFNEQVRDANPNFILKWSSASTKGSGKTKVAFSRHRSRSELGYCLKVSLFMRSSPVYFLQEWVNTSIEVYEVKTF